MTPKTRPPLLLLPGMDGTTAMFRPLLAALPNDIDAIPIEYPTRGHCDYECALAHIDAELQRHPRCDVLGWSFSGPLALRIARLRPARVRSVTMVASFVLPPRPWWLRLAPLLLPVVGSARLLQRLWPLRCHSPPRRDRADVLARVPAKALTRRLRAVRRVDARDDLCASTQPLLYLASSRDRLVPPTSLQQIRALRHDVLVQTIAGGHFALHKNAEAGAAAIVAFLRSLDADDERRGLCEENDEK